MGFKLTILKFQFKCPIDNRMQFCWLSKKSVRNAKQLNMVKKVNKYSSRNVNISTFHNCAKYSYLPVLAR